MATNTHYIRVGVTGSTCMSHPTLSVMYLKNKFESLKNQGNYLLWQVLKVELMAFDNTLRIGWYSIG